MQAADQLLAELAAQGIEVQVDENRLRYRPKDRVTPDLLERLREHKADVLAALSKTRLEERQNLPPPCRCHREQLHRCDKLPMAMPISRCRWSIAPTDSRRIHAKTRRARSAYLRSAC